jgi:hypothetical protein
MKRLFFLILPWHQCLRTEFGNGWQGSRQADHQFHLEETNREKLMKRNSSHINQLAIQFRTDVENKPIWDKFIKVKLSIQHLDIWADWCFKIIIIMIRGVKGAKLLKEDLKKIKNSSATLWDENNELVTDPQDISDCSKFFLMRNLWLWTQH